MIVDRIQHNALHVRCMQCSKEKETKADQYYDNVK